MATIFQKLRTIVLSNVHDLLDKTTDLNDVGAVRQRVRDLETALENLESGANEAQGGLRTLKREKGETEERIARLTATAEKFANDDDPTNDAIGEAHMLEVEGLEEQLADLNTGLEEAETTSANLTRALLSLKTEHEKMVRAVRRLEATERGTKAKESAANAIKMVGEMVKAGENVSVDSIVSRMNRRRDVADVAFEKSLGTLNDATGRDAALASAKSRFAEMKRKNGQTAQSVS